MSGVSYWGIIYLSTFFIVLGAILYFLIRKIPPNIFVGVRIGFTFISREVWIKVNREYGASLIALGIAVLILMRLGLPPNTLLTTSLVTSIVLTVVFLIRAYRLAEYYTTMKPEVSKGEVKALQPLKAGLLRTSLAIAPPIIIALLGIATYSLLPNQVAVHFDSNGLPNLFEDKDSFMKSTTPLFTILALVSAASIVLGRKLPIAFYNPWTTMRRFYVAVTDFLICLSWMLAISYVDLIHYNLLSRHLIDPMVLVTVSSILLILLIARVIYVCLVRKS